MCNMFGGFLTLLQDHVFAMTDKQNIGVRLPLLYLAQRQKNYPSSPDVTLDVVSHTTTVNKHWSLIQIYDTTK